MIIFTPISWILGFGAILLFFILAAVWPVPTLFIVGGFIWVMVRIAKRINAQEGEME